MRLIGKKTMEWGAYEAVRLIQALEPIALTAFLTWASGYISAMRDEGGWRAVLAVGIVGAWTAGRQYFADNSKGRL